MDKTISFLKLSIFIYMRRLVYLILGLFDSLSKRKAWGVSVYCYHAISNDNWFYAVSMNEFKKQLDYLCKTCRSISLEELDNLIKKNNIRKSHLFMISFDDGYQDILQVKDFCHKLNIKPALFLLSDRKDADRSNLGTDRPFLSKNDIIQLKNDGWVVGCHGAKHLDLKTLSDQQIVEEIVKSKRTLEKELDMQIKYFAYPKGVYTPEIIEAVRQAGYSLAFSMDDGFIQDKIDIFTLPRIGINRTQTFSEFKNVDSPTLVWFRGLIKKRYSVKF